MRMTRLLLALLLLTSCSATPSTEDGPEVVETDAATLDALTATDTIADLPDDDLPSGLPFSFERESVADQQPLTQEEVDAFSREMRAFFEDTDYFGWLLRMSHGVDESTGMRDYRLWWTDTFARKEDGAVSVVHNWYEDGHGGHNILKANCNILASALSAYLLQGGDTLAELSEQFCKGMSSTMLGMVHDGDDEVLHLMARNVVMSNHTYTTHDGREKTVDYSNWFFPYDRWNCSRFQYADNPYWGEVWVTNTRSKDGLGYVFWAWVPVLYASMRAEDPAVREACAETRDLLQAFAKDIVDNGYEIRTKDADGVPYQPGRHTGPPEADTGDLASFVIWDPLFPDAECNNKLAAALLAYGDPQDNACTPFGGDVNYEILSMKNNSPNGGIMRAFHTAAVELALLRGEDEIAQASLGGLDERFVRDTEVDLTEITSNVKSWHRGIAISKLRAANAGYPLSPDEVRELHGLYRRADEQFRAWEAWDLWDPALPDGEHRWRPPVDDGAEESERVYWMDSEAMGLLYNWCWSPFRNTAGADVVNCDILTGRSE